MQQVTNERATFCLNVSCLSVITNYILMWVCELQFGSPFVTMRKISFLYKGMQVQDVHTEQLSKMCSSRILRISTLMQMTPLHLKHKIALLMRLFNRNAIYPDISLTSDAMPVICYRKAIRQQIKTDFFIHIVTCQVFRD